MPHLAASPEKSPLLPHWISAWGQDEFGLFVEFSLATGDNYWSFIDQRLRRIPAGTFTMGSPDSEPGRFPHEGPQHQVRITHPFWLMDTPVTQRLWQHVMGDNPSRFVDPNRPVEHVDWHRCVEFSQKLTDLVGATFSLPTEAQWEYACRAGTKTATYAGEIEILGESNAPVLNTISWYGGNSGFEYDLQDGEDSSGWQERQFESVQAGTRKVAQKDPNAWGLYDMLGNVWEWCFDARRRFLPEETAEPIGPSKEAADRVIRGGSWANIARCVRAACRDERSPSTSDDDLGFRCVCRVAD